jgi:integrase
MPSDEQKAGYDQHTTHLHPNAVTSTKTAHNGEILNVLWELKKAGKADDTIRNVRKCLIVLDRLTNLQDPEAVKTFVATYDRNSGYKRNLIMAYEHYAKLYNFTWIKPKYHENAKMPKIPLEAKIDCIMTNAPLKLRTAIAISKDTGLRPVELMRLTLRSIDLQNGVVYPETAKHGSPRALRLTNKTVNILNKYVAAWNIDVNARLFGTWGDIRF